MQNRPLAAAASILAAMVIIGFIDQFIQGLSDRSSLWTFHLLRSGMMWGIAFVWVLATGFRLRVASWRGVLGRSFFVSLGLLVYFGALGFMPVSQAAAGLFTAPIWVLIFSVTVFGLRIGPVRLIAALIGFAGVVMVLAPDPGTLTWLSFAPLAAGAFYGVGVLATRSWCAGEQPLVLALGGFTFLALWGLIGVVIGQGDSFVTRGWVAPDERVWAVLALQAVGTLVAVVLLTRGYQLAEASIASIFEYSVLGFSAFFAWVLFGEVLGLAGFAGLALIALSGALIALRGRSAEVGQ